MNYLLEILNMFVFPPRSKNNKMEYREEKQRMAIFNTLNVPIQSLARTKAVHFFLTAQMVHGIKRHAFVQSTHSRITHELTLCVLIEDKASLWAHYHSYRQNGEFKTFSLFLHCQILVALFEKYRYAPGNKHRFHKFISTSSKKEQIARMQIKAQGKRKRNKNTSLPSSQQFCNIYYRL